MRNRSWRRAQRERAIARARRRASATGWGGHDPHREEWIRKNAITPHPCSSYCCGNPRKWFGELTWQERRASLNHLEQVVMDESQADD